MSNYTEADVNEAAHLVEEGLHTTTKVNPRKDVWLPKLAFLKAAALEGTKVPGLVETIQAAHRALSDAKVPTHDDPDDPKSKLHLCGRIRRLEGARLLSEQDRKSLRSEMQDASREVTALQSRVAELTRDMLALTETAEESERARIHAESERDALRADLKEAQSEVERVDRFYDEVAEVLDAAGIPVREDGTQQAERVKELVAERDALRAQVERLSGAITMELGKCCAESMPDEACEKCRRLNAALSAPPAETTQAEPAKRMHWIEKRRREALAAIAKHPPVVADDGHGTVSLVWHDSEQAPRSYAVTTEQMRWMLGDFGAPAETTAAPERMDGGE